MRFSLEQCVDHPENSTCILLFRDVTNASDLLSRTLDGELQAAFLKATLIPDIFVLLVATSDAVRKHHKDLKSTKNLFTEIVYNLSGTRNIRKALKIFGIDENTKQVLVVLPNATESQISLIRQSIRGTEISSIQDTLVQIKDIPAITKIHGITEQESADDLVNAIVTRMACRDIK